jgi:hypothetical protein
MSFVNEEKYMYTLTGSQQHYKLEYEIIIKDVKDDEHVYSIKGVNAIEQEYIPVFPVINIEWPLNLYIILTSSIVGVIVTIFAMYSRNNYSRKIRNQFLSELNGYAEQIKKKATTAESNNIASISELDQSRNKKEGLMELSRGKGLFLIEFVGSIVMLSFSLLTLLDVLSGSIGLVSAAAGLLLSTLTLYERVMIDATDRIYNERKIHYGLVIFILILMITMIIMFMLSGELVEWFNYYVVQDQFTIGPFEIPNLWISLFTPFLTIIIIILITTYKDLNSAIQEMEALKLAKENWKRIWQQKEERIKKINSALQMKMIIFIATILISLVSATQIGRYATIGIYLFGPFLLALIIVIAFNKAIARKEINTFKEALNSWIIEKTKICPQCKTENIFDNIYCTNCKFDFAIGNQIIQETKECNACKNRSPIISEYCRFCGTQFEKK